jgi:hypothetical protein
MTIEIAKMYPPDRESDVVELHVPHDGFIDIPVEIYYEGTELRIGVFGRSGGVSWRYPLDEFLDAIRRAVAFLGPPEDDRS